jgi:hypothetical protein
VALANDRYGEPEASERLCCLVDRLAEARCDGVEAVQRRWACAGTIEAEPIAVEERDGDQVVAGTELSGRLDVPIEPAAVQELVVRMRGNADDDAAKRPRLAQ